jgi:hypothetical protein
MTRASFAAMNDLDKRAIGPYYEVAPRKDIDAFMRGENEDQDTDDDEDENRGDEHVHDVDTETKTDGSTMEKLQHSIVKLLLQLFIFVDAYETTKLRNDVMSSMPTLRTEAEIWPEFDLVSEASQDLPTSSAFCRYRVLSTALFWDGAEPSKPEERPMLSLCPADFLLGVVKVHSARRFNSTGDKPLNKALDKCCGIHDHANNLEKEKCEA